MTNHEIAKLLKNIAAAYAIKDESKYRFQIIAYQKASDTVDHFTTEVSDLVKEKKLHILPNIGSSIRTYLEELVTNGKVVHFDQIMNNIPQAVFPLLEIPTFGPKKAYKLVIKFQLKNPETVIDDIKKAAENKKISQLEGFGIKSELDILQAIKEYEKGINKISRMVLPYASDIANKIIKYMELCPEVENIYPLGSLRRKKETIGDIDLAVSSSEPEKVIEHFIHYPYKERIIEKGSSTSSLLTSGGIHIDLMVQPSESFGSLLQHFTGSKEHNIRLREYALDLGLSLSEYGVRSKSNPDKIDKYNDEKDFYRALGLDWIPPEIRENTGEIELAKKHRLPRLVENTDIKGDFHLHSNYPIETSHDMGIDSMKSMIKKADKLGYKYIGFSEHNPSVSKHSDSEIYQILYKRKKVIEQINKSNNSVRVLSLLETDILPNGHLAVNDESLALLDATLVSIHSVFSMNKLEMTKRVIKGLSHPKAKILSHPTGRLLNQRLGYDLDWSVVFAFCSSEDKAIEINAYPTRLDLPYQLVRQAIENKVKLAINTDSHSINQMNLMEYGVSVARRGWATKNDILNAQEYNKVIEFFNN